MSGCCRNLRGWQSEVIDEDRQSSVRAASTRYKSGCLASFIPVGLPSKFGARLHGSGAFSEETIAAAALLDYEALTRKAAELRFSTLQPPGEFCCRFVAGAATPNSRKLSPPRPSGLAVH